MSVSQIVNPRSTSFEQIREDLLNYVRTGPDAALWEDFFVNSDGAVIVEWLAGITAFERHGDIMRIREGSLDHAQLTSSVFEIAFSRGLLVPPAHAAELTISARTTTTGAELLIHKGDRIGSLSNYGLYAKDAFTLTNVASDVVVIVGFQTIYEQAISNPAPFSEFVVYTPYTYIAAQLEEFRDTENEINIPLHSEPQYSRDMTDLANFILRRVNPSEVRIYGGNGILGWYDPNCRSIRYTCYSYNDDVTDLLANEPRNELSGVAFVDTTISKRPSFNPDKEEIRAMTRYYPLDGRIVNDRDYEAFLIKTFGGYVRDSYSFNSDPEQEIYILKDVNFGTGPVADALLEEIEAAVDAKRALGMKVNYYPVEIAEGLTFTTTLIVPKSSYSASVLEQINSFCNKYILKFMRKTGTFHAYDLAFELSAELGIAVRPQNTAYSVAFTETDFFSEFSVTVIAQ